MRPVVPSPTSTPPSIGPRLRHARQLRRLTIAQVADAAGVTKGFISRLERDEASPSVATLVALCEVLSLDVGSLFAAPDRQLVSLKTAPPINMGGSGVIERLMTPRNEARVQVIWSRAEPGGNGGSDLYAINCETETLQVLRGEVTLVFSDQEILVGAGDALTFAGRDAHTWKNSGEAVLEMLWIIAPAPWSGSAE